MGYNPDGPVEIACVTVNIASAYLPPAPVAATLYVPGDTDGIVNTELMPPDASADVDPTFVVPKLMLTEPPEVNPDPVTLTIVPLGPWVELNHMVDAEGAVVEGFCVTVNNAVA